MKVSVRFFAQLQDLTGIKTSVMLDLGEDARITDLLDKLILDSKIRHALLSADGNIKSDLTILRNGREIRFLNGLDTPLQSGDEVSIFSLVVGGS